MIKFKLSLSNHLVFENKHPLYIVISSNLYENSGKFGRCWKISFGAYRLKAVRGRFPLRSYGPALVSRLQGAAFDAVQAALLEQARDSRLLTMLGFSIAAWKLAPHDSFIGKTPQLREKNLPLVIDNLRFLVQPWIKISNLGSHLLAIACPRTGPNASTPPPCSSRRSSRPPAIPAPSTGHWNGYASEPHRVVDATTSPKRTYGCGRSAVTGSISSTAETRAITPRPNVFTDTDASECARVIIHPLAF